MKRQTSTLITAPAGTGKSYFVTKDALKFLAETKGSIWHNMPWGLVPDNHSSPPVEEGETFVERMERYNRVEEGTYADRVLPIPESELTSWRMGEGGPWSFFDDVDLSGCWIVIDEAHNYAPKRGGDIERKWQLFCGELRHRGASIVFITQHPTKLAVGIRNECGVRLALIDAEEERDPFFQIKMYYWYQLAAKFRGKYISYFVRIELRDVDGSKRGKSDVERVVRDSDIFALYDSFVAPQASGLAAKSIDLAPWQRYSLIRLIFWFLSSNSGRLAKPLVVFAFIVLLLTNGKTMFDYFLSGFSGAVGSSVRSSESLDNPPAASTLTVSETVGVEIEFPVFRVVMITRDAVTIDGLGTYPVGEAIKIGGSDVVVEAIEVQRRRVVFDIGRVLLGESFRVSEDGTSVIFVGVGPSGTNGSEG